MTMTADHQGVLVKVLKRGLPAAVAVLVALSLAPAPATGALAARRAGAAATNPSTWQPYLLTSPDQFRLQAPPADTSRKTKRELKELREMQADRGRKHRRQVRFWNNGFATRRWTEITLDMIVKHKQRPPFAGRALAYVHTAMYDAMIAAYDSRGAYERTAPKKLDSRIDPILSASGTTYPPVMAAIAGAAETMLTALFPNEPARTFEEFATEAVESRLWAGVNYRSDVERGRKLGQDVAGLFLERMTTDGSTNSTVAHPKPPGDGFWEPTPPGFEANIGGPVGTWKPWLMTTPDQARADSALPPPFAFGTPEFMDELQEVIDVQANLTSEQQTIAQFWDDSGGTYTPAGHWFDIAIDLAKNNEMNTPEAARMLALLGALEADAAIAFFEAKYLWWSIRPVTAVRRLCENATRLCTKEELAADPSLATYPDWLPYLLTPAFPAYPGGHSTFSGSAGKALEYFFPDASGLLNQQADEAAISRLFGGIHFRSDNDAGLVLGRKIADYAIARAQNDGSGL
jgi:PAP2 superfamily